MTGRRWEAAEGHAAVAAADRIAGLAAAVDGGLGHSAGSGCVLARDGLREVGRGVHARQELKEKTRMATEGGSEGLKNGTEDEEKEVNGVRRGSETA